MQLVPRPGAVARIDIPVLQTSEVEGTVHLQQGNRRREIGGVLVEIGDQAGQVVGTSICGADDYYVVAGVPAGEYQVRVSPDQLQRLGLQESTVRHVTVTRDSWLVSGIDIELGESLALPNTKPDP